MRSLRHRRQDPQLLTDSDGTWAISYGDMITLLLTFFIIFFSTSRSTDNSKGIQQTLLKTLSASEADSGREQSANTRAPSSLHLGTLRQGDSIEDILPSDWGALKVLPAGNKLLITFKDLSFFRFGEIEITEEARWALEKFARIYLPYAGTNTLSIRAYTDDKPVRQGNWKKFSDNLELSALRSVTAMRTLQKAGIPLNRMKLGGWGELTLTAQELTEAKAKAGENDPGTPLARKVVLVIEPEVRDHI